MKPIHLFTRLLPAMALAWFCLLSARGQGYVSGDKYQDYETADEVSYYVSSATNLGGGRNNGRTTYLNDGSINRVVSAPNQGESVIVMDLGSSHDPVNRIYIYRRILTNV